MTSLGKKLIVLVIGLLATILLSACDIELQIPVVEAPSLQKYTISGLPRLNNPNFAASLTVDDVLEFSINGKIIGYVESNNNQQIPPFVFDAYPNDKITLRGINTNAWTGCGIGDVYLLTSSKSYKLTEAQSNLICSKNEVFYKTDYKLPSN